MADAGQRGESGARPSVWISGAARGIGRACAESFAAAGWRVGLYDLDVEGLEETVAELGAASTGAKARLVQGRVDVTDEGSVAAALEAFVEAAGGRLDALVNNAGVMHVGAFESVPLAAHRQTIAVNFQGVLTVAHAAFPYLRQSPGARLINMSSAAAIHGVPEMASYSATKHAVRGLTEALAIEWARYDIRVCDVMPMFVRTRLLSGTAPLTSEGFLGVHLEAKDVAEVVLTAATGRSSRLHWPVGVQSKLAHRGRGLAPERLTAFVLRRLAKL